MQEKVKGFFQKIKQWWLSAAKKTKILLGAGAAAVLVVIALVLVVSLNQPYTVLFTGLNQTDLTAIVSYLSDNGVTDYQIQEEDTVLVPESQEEQLKAVIAELNSELPDLALSYDDVTDSAQNWVDTIKMAAEAQAALERQAEQQRAYGLCF